MVNFSASDGFSSLASPLGSSLKHNQTLPGTQSNCLGAAFGVELSEDG